MSYEIFTQSVRGSSHIRKNIPREDAGIKLDENGIKVFAVADGHGDSRCCRAHIGSDLICKIAAAEMNGFAQTIQKEDWINKLFDEKECKKLIETLVTSIIGKWGNAVNDEFEHNPLSEAELAAASGLDIDFSTGVGVEKLYGTTLISGLLTDRYLLLLQQGDGRCDVFDAQGDVSQPIPWDERCVGTGTTSVCDNDAIQSTRFYLIDLGKTPVIACIAGTDGVEDSFPMSMDKVHAYYRNMIIYCCDEGVEKLEQYLETELSELSKNGSADDVTVSGIVDVDKCKPFIQRFKDENELVNIGEDIKAINMKISSVENGGKYTHFKKIYDDAVAKFTQAYELVNAAAKEYKTLKDVIEAQENFSENGLDAIVGESIQKLILPKKSVAVLKAELEKKRIHFIEMKKNLDDAEQEKNKAESDFAPLMEKYENLLQLRKEKEEELRSFTDELKKRSLLADITDNTVEKASEDSTEFSEKAKNDAVDTEIRLIPDDAEEENHILMRERFFSLLNIFRF